MDLNALQKKALSLPLLPGVYIMKDRKGEVIYVGKAKKLKNRVSSYFRTGASHTPKVEKMVSHVHDFDVIVVDSEFEALTLECSMIKQHRPRYNILLMDDKGFSYIRVSDEKFPRITAELQKRDDGASYYGPYISSFAVKRMTDTVNEAFRLPTCTYNFEKITRKRACLNAHLGRCCAPCVGEISREAYLELVDSAVTMLLKGSGEILDILEERMMQASEALEFERAARYRDSIISIRKLEEGQKVVKNDSSRDMDVFAFAANEKMVCADVLKFRDGMLVDKEEQLIYDTSDIDEAREEFVTHYYLNGNEIPREVLCDKALEYQEQFREWLSVQRNSAVSVSVPQRGERKSIVEMAYSNASDRIKRESGRKTRNEAMLGELASMLGMESYPERIELYDISNYGEDAVGGMVVFQNGEPRKSEYRRFRIKSVQGIDDYASTAEVISRRIARYDEVSKGFDTKPDLILLDGGKGHLDTVKGVVADSSFADVPIFGLVKDAKHRTRAIVSEDGEIAVSMHKSIFSFVSKMQDEVHRYTIEYERKSHSSRAMRSSLLDIDGIGETRAKALLKHFKTISAVSEASQEELSAVKGMNVKSAEAVWKHFHAE
jgi:excinuclease ABC subunit C